MHSVVEISEAHVTEKLLVREFLELCLSELAKLNSPAGGRDAPFDYPWFDLYWTDATRVPFLIRSGSSVAGFALVRMNSGASCDWDFSIAEFFMLPTFRRHQIGRVAVRLLLARRPGIWEIASDVRNLAARSFWSKVARGFNPTAQPVSVAPNRESYLVRSHALPAHASAARPGARSTHGQPGSLNHLS